MEYNFREIEQKWQKFWKENQIYKTEIDTAKPKYYVLDMFPYPSGAGLHVGHPLGYIASDIYSRYKRLKGFNVLHPMGYDAYGLPAEQYAIQTGQHPAVTTKKNIDRYREQLDKIGFCYDWDREIRTCEPDYYKWTQWAFIQMFNHYFNTKLQKAQPISLLVQAFETDGTYGINASCTEELSFTADDWKSKTEKEQQEILLNYRIAYLADLKVNWCPALGTVLANDEVSEGLSVRGGHPVEQRVMRQWSLRVSAYAQRLLDGLDKIDWTESLKETQKNWIGRSEGAELRFYLPLTPSKGEGEAQISTSLSTGGGQGEVIEVFTTRADTIYGVTFMVLAPESELVAKLTTDDQKTAVEEYIAATKKRTERERIADRRVTGVFSGSYAINPVSGTEIPVWISDYVLAGYGTGAIMAVPAHDSRDYAFAKHFNLPIIPLIEGCDVSEESFDAKEGIMCNSGFLNGLTVKEAIAAAKKYIEEKNLGRVKVNYRLRDAIFSRQRYWGEPFPVYYKDGMPYMLDESKLPLELPEIDKFLPTEKGEPPLGRAKDWYYLPPTPSKGGGESSDLNMQNVGDLHSPSPSGRVGEGYNVGDLQSPSPIGRPGVGYNVDDLHTSPPLEGTEGRYPLELNTMPGFAGSSAYYLRYMDSKNDKALVSPEANQYWRNVDLYIGGTEHATGHLIYSRFWNKFLFDLGIVCEEEPFKKLINQGMIQGRSNFVYRIKDTNTFVSLNLKDQYETTPIHVDVNIVSNDILDIQKFKAWRPEFADAEFILENPNPTFPKGEGVSSDSNSQNVGDLQSLSPLGRVGEGSKGRYICGWAVEKMSKSMFNVVNPDDIVEKYGADTLRLYEMFLGPLEQSKPWDTNGIDGVHRFLKKLWALFYKDDKLIVSDEAPNSDELKSLHKTIKKITYDIENFSFNTSVAAFMICVNELTAVKCSKKAILEPLVILLAPFAPHVAEELYHLLGNTTTVNDAVFPLCNEEYLVENTVKYPVSFNGKVRFMIDLPANMSKEDVEKEVFANEQTTKHLAGNSPKKVIVVSGKIVNIVL